MEHKLRFEELNLTKETVYAEMGYGKAVPDDNVKAIVDKLFVTAADVVKPRLNRNIINI